MKALLVILLAALGFRKSSNVRPSEPTTSTWGAPSRTLDDLKRQLAFARRYSSQPMTFAVAVYVFASLYGQRHRFAPVRSAEIIAEANRILPDVVKLFFLALHALGRSFPRLARSALIERARTDAPMYKLAVESGRDVRIPRCITHVYIADAARLLGFKTPRVLQAENDGWQPYAARHCHIVDRQTGFAIYPQVVRVGRAQFVTVRDSEARISRASIQSSGWKLRRGWLVRPLHLPPLPVDVQPPPGPMLVPFRNNNE